MGAAKQQWIDATDWHRSGTRPKYPCSICGYTVGGLHRFNDVLIRIETKSDGIGRAIELMRGPNETYR